MHPCLLWNYRASRFSQTAIIATPQNKSHSGILKVASGMQCMHASSETEDCEGASGACLLVAGLERGFILYVCSFSGKGTFCPYCAVQSRL